MKKFKVIKLDGMHGLLFVLTAVIAVLGCITILPVYGVKYVWNTFLCLAFGIQTIRLSQAALLWGAVLACIFGYLRSRIRFKMVSSMDFPDRTLSNTDYEKFMEEIKKEQEKNEKINR